MPTDPGPAFADELVEFIGAEVAAPGDPIDPSTDLLTSGRIDSLGIVMLVDWIEARIDMPIDPGEILFEHFVSVEAMVAFLQTRVVAADATAEP